MVGLLKNQELLDKRNIELEKGDRVLMMPFNTVGTIMEFHTKDPTKCVVLSDTKKSMPKLLKCDTLYKLSQEDTSNRIPHMGNTVTYPDNAETLGDFEILPITKFIYWKNQFLEVTSTESDILLTDLKPFKYK